MHPEMERIQNCLAAVRRHTDFVPEVAVVLGSGLGGFADMVKQTAVVPYSEIPGFPVSTAPGHAGRFVFGYVEETPVVVMQGRVHLYEGYTPHDVVLPVRLMKAMGAKILFVTNASGGIRGDLTAGTLMSITDHISALIPNPLIGANIDELGVRFPPLFRLIAAGESQNQLHLRVEAPRFQNGLRCERIKAQGSAAVKGGDALLDQLFDDFLQPLLQVKKIVLWNSSMACKAATIHKKGRLSARYKGISLKTV